jgi:hypothetical protein
MENTGYKSFAFLEKYYTDDNTPTEEIKPNVATDPDYIAPVLDIAACPPATRYYNTKQTKIVAKNNCSPGETGTEVELIAYPNQFVSYESTPDANNQALAWLENNAQIYANNLGTCTPAPILSLAAVKSVIFEKRARSWSESRDASAADLQHIDNTFIGTGADSLLYYVNRYRGVIDTSSITIKPKSAKIKFRFAENTVGNVLTFNLFGSNVQIPLNQEFQLVDWNDWDNGTYINSISVPSNSTAYTEINLTSSQLDLLVSGQAYNFFLISNGDKDSSIPGSNSRPVLSITAETGQISLECQF